MILYFFKRKYNVKTHGVYNLLWKRAYCLLSYYVAYAIMTSNTFPYFKCMPILDQSIKSIQICLFYIVLECKYMCCIFSFTGVAFNTTELFANC